MEEKTRKSNPVRLSMRGIFAVGIGLGAAAIWWEYSDQILARILPLLGIGLL
ncbi:MAG: hypothetical protein ACR2PH_02560 [Desulfobulbia bacterium]